MITSVLVIKTIIKAIFIVSKLQLFLYILYPTHFGLSIYIEALIDSNIEINIIQSSFAKNLDFHIYIINVSTQKINSSKLKTFEIVITSFLIDNKDRKSHFLR